MKGSERKLVWVDCRPWSKKLVLAALESGADAVIVPPGRTKAVRELGRLKTVAEDGDLKLGKAVVEIEISGLADQEKIIALAPDRTAIVSGRDWKIIPLENIIARSGKVMAVAGSLPAARTALGILERGVAGVVVRSSSPKVIGEIVRLVRGGSEKLELVPVRITGIEELGMGDRVCVDTSSVFAPGEGMLVGNTGSSFFLVHAETVETPYVAPRPFRVNAGGVHAYTFLPGGKTGYLSELKIGQGVLAVDFRGRTREAIVGRAKVEKRPMLLVRGKSGKREVSLILQNAETIRLVRTSGKPLSVAALKKGDEVLAHFSSGGRHFGTRIEETITEK